MNDLKHNELIEQIEKPSFYDGEEFTIILYKFRNIKERTIEYWTTYKNYGQVNFYIGIHEKDMTTELDENNKHNAFVCAFEQYIENEF